MARIRHPLLVLTFAVAALAAWPWSGDAPAPVPPSPHASEAKPTATSSGHAATDGPSKAMGSAAKTSSMGSGAMGPVKKEQRASAVKQVTGMGKAPAMGRKRARKARAKARRVPKAVPLNPTHGHHPEASHKWHQVSGAKTTYKVLRPGYKVAAYIKGGDTVTMHATGKVQDSGEKFWSTKDIGHKAFTYVQGAGVIRAWDSGTRGMRVGERRQLRIPADEAFGADGFTHWNVPPNKDLEFELEVLKIKSKPKKLEL